MTYEWCHTSAKVKEEEGSIAIAGCCWKALFWVLSAMIIIRWDRVCIHLMLCVFWYLKRARKFEGKDVGYDPSILKATPVDLCHVPLKSEFWSHFHRKKDNELCFHLTCPSLLRRAQKSHTLLFDDEKWAAVANQAPNVDRWIPCKRGSWRQG